jgi:mRNA interferase MazF
VSGYVARQGDIIKLNFDPQSGHEQSGRRPAIVISNADANFILNTRAIVCPITRTNKGIVVQPLLDSRTRTQGAILCDQIRTVDLQTRKAEYIEPLPEDILLEVIDIVYGMIERVV